MFTICSEFPREIDHDTSFRAHSRARRRRAPASQGVAFRDAAQAWFWTVGALAARRDGTGRGDTGRGGARIPRPCDPDDVIRCLDTLYRRRRIDLAHARVLRVWGERGTAPDAARPAEQAAARLWHEALGRLDWLLRMKGIVA